MASLKEFSVRSMLLEAHRCLRKSELDLGVELGDAMTHVAAALASLDSHPCKCRRCWGAGAVKCALCGGSGERGSGKEQRGAERGREPGALGAICARCAGGALERCPACAGYGLTPPP